MPKGHPKDWTLEELQTIWTFDGSDGRTVEEASVALGITRASWYSLKSRLRKQGGPEQLHAKMQKDKLRRYNRAMDPEGRGPRTQPETLEDALRRTYVIRINRTGRDMEQIQYTVTIPPLLAVPFIAEHGRYFQWEPMENGILLKSLPEDVNGLPAWLVQALERSGE